MTFDSTKAVVVVEGNIGVVGVSNRALKCISCDSHYCPHTAYISDMKDDSGAPDCVLSLKNQQETTFKQRESVVVSQEPIAVKVEDSMHQYYRQCPNVYMATVTEGSSTYLKACDFIEECPKCGSSVSKSLGKCVRLYDKYNVHLCMGK